MPVPSEPFAAVYEDPNRLGVIVAHTGRAASRLTRPTIIAWDCFRPRARLPPRSLGRALG
jgi:hypothetical protein